MDLLYCVVAQAYYHCVSKIKVNTGEFDDLGHKNAPVICQPCYIYI